MATSPATACPLDCADACGVLVETDEHGLFRRIRGNPAHSYSRGSLCGKTAIYSELVTSPERLRTPLRRTRGGGFEPVTWETAIDEIAERVAPLAGRDVLALSYAGCMGLVQRHYPMRVLHRLGATETDGGVCDNTATVGYQVVLGHVVGADLETIEDCDLLLIWGSDLARTVQHTLPRVKRLCERGVPVVAIDVYRTDTIRKLEAWGGHGLVLRPGTDAALALALARLAFEEGRADRAYLERECLGATDFEQHVRSGHELAQAAATTGLAPERVRWLADLVARSERPFVKTGVGFARRRNGGSSMRAVCSLAAVLGCADRLHFESGEHFGFDADVVRRPHGRPDGAPTVPIRHVEVGRELTGGRFRAVFVWGHNPAETLPDSNRVRAGLARDDLFVVVHEQFLTATARLADLVLPATTFVEQSDVYRSYGHRVAQYGRKAVEPPHAQRSNVDTFRALAKALGQPREVWDTDADALCRELLEAARERIGEPDLARLLAGEPVKLRPRAFADRGTPSGRIELVSETCRSLGQPAMASFVPDDGARGRGRFTLVSAPSVATHNTTFLHSSRHTERAGTACCWLNPGDARRLDVADGAHVVLSNEQGKLTFPVALSDDVPAGLVRVDGFPREEELPERVGINALTSPLVSDLGDGNVLYSARVDVVPA